MYDRSKERIIGQNYILDSAVKALKLSLWISHPDMRFNLANPRRLLRSDIHWPSSVSLSPFLR
jgi:hypothetical protein